eukprot:TRINITY_DN14207_c0_g2_i1.p1 TRINITY_DN14207_c0_g2~~TRINITY_DN14207_c0_g2_i1.p1  ORF type:complete len:861 (-),score=166.09 TRINITY_DN14207_c0_g2_i1:86-2668(-)
MSVQFLPAASPARGLGGPAVRPAPAPREGAPGFNAIRSPGASRGATPSRTQGQWQFQPTAATAHLSPPVASAPVSGPLLGAVAAAVPVPRQAQSGTASVPRVPGWQQPLPLPRQDTLGTPLTTGGIGDQSTPVRTAHVAEPSPSVGGIPGASWPWPTTALPRGGGGSAGYLVSQRSIPREEMIRQGALVEVRGEASSLNLPTSPASGCTPPVPRSPREGWGPPITPCGEAPSRIARTPATPMYCSFSDLSGPIADGMRPAPDLAQTRADEVAQKLQTQLSGFEATILGGQLRQAPDSQSGPPLSSRSLPASRIRAAGVATQPAELPQQAAASMPVSACGSTALPPLSGPAAARAAAAATARCQDLEKTLAIERKVAAQLRRRLAEANDALSASAAAAALATTGAGAISGTAAAGTGGVEDEKGEASDSECQRLREALASERAEADELRRKLRESEAENERTNAALALAQATVEEAQARAESLQEASTTAGHNARLSSKGVSSDQQLRNLGHAVVGAEAPARPQGSTAGVPGGILPPRRQAAVAPTSAETSQLFAAAAAGDADELKRQTQAIAHACNGSSEGSVADEQRVVLEARDETERTLLHAALEGSDPKDVLAFVFEQRDGWYRRAKHDLDLKAEFLERDLVGYVNSADRSGRSPLAILCARTDCGAEHQQLAAGLLQAQADVGARDKEGLTPFLTCAKHNNVAIMNVLLHCSRGAVLNDFDHAYRTALHLAAREGHSEAVEALLQVGADMESIDEDGRTAGDEARDAGHDELAALLGGGPSSNVVGEGDSSRPEDGGEMAAGDNDSQGTEENDQWYPGEPDDDVPQEARVGATFDSQRRMGPGGRKAPSHDPEGFH